MRFIFPYGIKFRENGKIETFPAIEISIFAQGGLGIRAFFHVDSGATTSILPESDADVLGINLKSGKKVTVRGISGKFLVGYRHLIDIQFNKKLKIRIPAVFIVNVFVPRILGREDIFPRFGILFDEYKQRTVLLDTEKERKTIDSLFD